MNLGNAEITPRDQSSDLSMISFIDGATNNAHLLRSQLLASVTSAFPSSARWRCADRSSAPAMEQIRVSFFVKIPSEILLQFDLADRNYFQKYRPDKTPLVRDFRKIFVPGPWMVQRLLEDSSLQLRRSDVIPIGSTRVDYLRMRQAELTSPAPDERLRVLFAPLHDDWMDGEGQPMSCRAEMQPYLESLRLHVDLAEMVDGRISASKEPVTEELLWADIVITDYTSLIYEAWALGKPVIFPNWLMRDRILQKAPCCAEAQIMRERIGHHAESFQHLLALLSQGRELGLGAQVDAFMSEYLSNYHEGVAGQALAQALTHLADPDFDQRMRRLAESAKLAQQQKDWPEAELLLTELLRFEPSDGQLHDDLATVFNNQGKWWQEVSALEAAIALSPPSAEKQRRLGAALGRMRKPRAAANAYATAIKLAPQKATADWYYRLGHMWETPGSDAAPDPAAASAAYAQALALTKDGSEKFGVGGLHAKSGRWKEAQVAYRMQLADLPFQSEIALEAELRYRLGMAHDRCYEWPEAQANYESALALVFNKPYWHYRLGFVLERQGEFSGAAEAYLEGVKLSEKPQPLWLYRAGLALEKVGRFAEACEAFAAMAPDEAPQGQRLRYVRRIERRRPEMLEARLERIRVRLKRDKNDDALWLEHSRLLEESGDLVKAAEAVQEAMVRASKPNPAYVQRYARLVGTHQEGLVVKARLERNCLSPEDWIKMSRICEKSQDFEGATRALRQALWRTERHDPILWDHLGRLLLKQGRLEEACEAFRSQNLIQRPHGAYDEHFRKDPAVRFHAVLRELHDLLPICKRTILYESHAGAGLGCNPFSIFEALVDRPGFEDWEHVWVVSDTDAIPERYRASPRIFFVQRGSDLYVRFLSTCEILINNGTFPEWFVRKPEQSYLNTWHGTPFKALGSDMKLPLSSRANTTRNFLQATHMIFPNAHTHRVLMEGHSVQELASARRLISGYPRNDQLLRADPEARTAVLAQLGLSADKPVVLYAPTYRGAWGDPELETAAFIQELEAMKGEEHVLVFRGHHLIEHKLKGLNAGVVIAPQHIDTNALLLAVDVLVSDYSSIIFDYMVTKRPVIQYTPDFDQYAEERGLYFSKQEMPGRICMKIEEVADAIGEALEDPVGFLSPTYKKLHAQHCAVEDGAATERVIAFLFSKDEAKGKSAHADFAKKGVVVRSVFGTINGIASSASALVKNLSRKKRPVALVLDAVELKKGEVGDDAIRELERHAAILIRSGALSMTLEEQWLWMKFRTDAFTGAPEMHDRLLHGFKYENDRLFGPNHAFQVAVEHQGYHASWGWTLARTNAQKRAIYLHNDMLLEAESRLPNLARIFQIYGMYDALISVSESSHLANMAKLIPLAPETAGRYRVVRNGLDKQELLLKADLDIDDPDLTLIQEDSRFKLINLARLWPEKNQERLLEAMRLLIEAGEDVSLYILGAGPLRAQLGESISAKQLEGKAHLLGVKRNPFPFLKAADCHVLSSDYEGQGIVLLEAMTIGKPCVSTDIPGPRSVLENGLGLLTDLTPEALAAAISKIMKGAFHPLPFDAEQYNNEALQEFLRAVNIK